MTKPKVYLSGPMTGLDFEEAQNWRQEVAQALRPEILPVSPMRGKDYLQGKVLEFDYPDKVLSNSKAIISRDYYDTTTADAMLVNLLGSTTVSIGTVVEIGWAYAQRIPTVLVLDREDESSPYRQHPLILEAAGWITDDLQEAVWVLKQILLPDPEPPASHIPSAGDPFVAVGGYGWSATAEDDGLVRVSGYTRRRPKAS